MLPAADEVVLIGIGGARIVRVSEEVVEYITMAGQKSVIDLKECASNWCASTTSRGTTSFPWDKLPRKRSMPRILVVLECAASGGFSS